MTEIRQNVKLTGKFGESGTCVFNGYFEFEMAIRKVDCEMILCGKLARFGAEELLLDGSTVRWAPETGWCPVLIACSDTLQLQGRPGATWCIEAHVAKHEVPDYARRAVPFPECDGAVIDCMPYVDPLPKEERK